MCRRAYPILPPSGISNSSTTINAIETHMTGLSVHPQHRRPRAVPAPRPARRGVRGGSEGSRKAEGLCRRGVRGSARPAMRGKSTTPPPFCVVPIHVMSCHVMLCHAVCCSFSGPSSGLLQDLPEVRFGSVFQTARFRMPHHLSPSVFPHCAQATFFGHSSSSVV